MKRKYGVKHYAIHYVSLAAAAVLMALSLHIFVLPAHFAPGGVSGLASIVQTLTDARFPAGYTLIILNAPLLLLAFLFLGRRFAVDTVVATVITSACTELFRQLGVYQFEGQQLLAAIAGGVMTGVGIGILVKIGASSGGTDIVGLFIQRKNSSLSISWLIFATDAVVVVLGGVLYLAVLRIDPTDAVSVVLFSFITLFVGSKAMEVVLNGFTSAVKFEVITGKAEELSDAIISELKRGVTIVESRGGYTKTPNNTLVCVVRSRQIAQFRKLLKAVDPNAFAFATNTREVLGNGFNE